MVDIISAISSRPTNEDFVQAPVRGTAQVESLPELKVRTKDPVIERVDQANQSTAVPISDFGLSTYRDQESGRVIIRVYDRRSGDVLVELPPETQRSAFSAPEPPPPLGKNTKIDV